MKTVQQIMQETGAKANIRNFRYMQENYTYKQKIRHAEYGEIVRDKDGTLRTTLAQRTGCTMCGFGIHLEQRPNRFDRLRSANPKEWEFWMRHVCRDENGDWYGWGRVLDYIGVKWENEPGQLPGQMSIEDYQT